MCLFSMACYYIMGDTHCTRGKEKNRKGEREKDREIIEYFLLDNAYSVSLCIVATLTY